MQVFVGRCGAGCQGCGELCWCWEGWEGCLAQEKQMSKEGAGSPSAGVSLVWSGAVQSWPCCGY